MFLNLHKTLRICKAQLLKSLNPDIIKHTYIIHNAKLRDKMRHAIIRINNIQFN